MNPAFYRCLLVTALTLLPFGVEAQTVSKSNGIISYTANDRGFPMISTLSVLGTELLPFDNAGAGYQMTGRSENGDSYNPTQAGDCTQTASSLTSLNSNWAGNPLALPSSYGLLMTVTPRNYNEPATGCAGVGALLPYVFEFGATLGDGSGLAQQGMLLEMAITRQAGSQVLHKQISEFPVIYLKTQVLPLAYTSADGQTWQPMNMIVNGVPTNDVRSWPYNPNQIVYGKGIMACTVGQTMCLAFYSERTTELGMTHRIGAAYELSGMWMAIDASGFISDFQRHLGRRLMAVGTPSTVTAVINHARSVMPNWGDI